MMNKQSDEEKVDPKENDSCVSHNDRDEKPKSTFDKLGKQAKGLVSNKHYVVIILLCLLVLVLFILVIALAAHKSSGGLSKGDEQCATPGCLTSAATFASKLRSDVDPCTDFWSYSCGGWLNRNPLPKNKGSNSIDDQLKKNIYERVRHVIDLVPQDASIRTPEWKVNRFFRACMKVGEIEYWSPKYLKRKIDEIGGWAVLKKWELARWDLNEVLAKLQVDMGVHPFFRILVEVNDADPYQHIIKIVPHGLGLPGKHYYFKPHDDEYATAYKNFIHDTLTNFEVSYYEATRFADDIFNYEKRLAFITPNPEDLRSSKHFKIVQVQDLNTLCPRINWFDLLQAYFPSSIRPSTQVAILSEEYLNKLSHLLSTTDEPVLNNYVIWRLVSAYSEHLSRNHRVVLNKLKQTFEGVSQTSDNLEERWEFCVRTTNQYLGHAVTAMYVQRYLPLGTGKEIQHLLYKVLGAFVSNLNKIPWLMSSSFETAREKLHETAFLVGYPQFIMNKTSLENYYNEFQVQNEHMQNVINGENFQKKKQQALLETRATNDSRWTIYGIDTKALYSYAGNYLVVPLALFDELLFEQDLSMPMTLGIMAGHLANKVAQALDDRGVLYKLNGIFDPWLDNRSSEVFQEKQECLQFAIGNYSFKNVTVRPELTVGSAVSDIGGVKLAYLAFKNYINKGGKPHKLPTIEVSNEQVFFISYAQSLCEALRPTKLKAWADASELLPNSLRVMGSLKQLPEFSEAFHCPRGSPMNPSKYCHLW